MTDAHAAGILPCQTIEELIAQEAITAATPFDVDQVQPASLDLRLGARAWRIRASFLPGLHRRVPERLRDVAMHELDLTKGAVLEKGCVYIAELMEGLKLPAGLRAAANPKSSTGRLDVFTRVITDRAREFDLVEDGYEGPLFIEISPRTFPVLVRSGSRLSQIRFRAGESRLDDRALGELHQSETLVTAAEDMFVSPETHQRLDHSAGLVWGVSHDLVRDVAADSDMVGPLYWIVGERLLLTGRREALQSIRLAADALNRGETVEGPVQLFELIIEYIIDDVARAVVRLMDETDDVEDKVLADSFDDAPASVGAVRRMAVRLHRQLGGLHLAGDCALPDQLITVHRPAIRPSAPRN